MGDQSALLVCPTPPCGQECTPIECRFSEWSQWSPASCSHLCERERRIARMNKCGGSACDGALSETKRCPRPDCSQGTPCVLGAWQEWSACDLSSGGQRVRERAVSQQPRNGGTSCAGNLVEVLPCTDPGILATRDCSLATWGDWDDCTEVCGSGTHERQRKIDRPATGGGKPCTGSMVELEPCNTQACLNQGRIDCVLSGWSEWLSCTSNNQQHRKRFVAENPQNGGQSCLGSLEEVRACNIAVDCLLTKWTAWDECDKSCDGGQRQRQRQVVKTPRNGGLECPSGLVETQGCNRNPCPNNVNCRETPWTEWGECSSTCGPGYQVRYRDFTQKLSHCGSGCVGDMQQVKECERESCDCVDCVWGQWSQWSACSRHCGGGQHQRERNITRWPRPGCNPCEPKDKVYVEPCNTKVCPDNELCVDGEWNDWHDWEGCSTTCEGGQAFRTRSVRSEATSCGKPPLGDSREEGPCMVGVPCKADQDCEFSQWTLWTDCSASCNGLKKRSRRIAIHGFGSGTFCEGALNETWPCSLDGHSALTDWTSPQLYLDPRTVAENNLDGKGPLGGRPVIRYSRVAHDGARSIDLVITTDNAFFPADSHLNGLMGVFGNINLVGEGASVDVTMTLVDSATAQPVEANDLVLKFVDLDPGDNSNIVHSIQVNTDCEEFYLADKTVLQTEGVCGKDKHVLFRKPVIAEPSCASGWAQDLDLTQVIHSNLGGKGPDAGRETLHFQNVAKLNGRYIDLIIYVADQSDYSPSNAKANGRVGLFGLIDQQPGTAAHFKARFVETGSSTPVRVPKFNLTFFDIDETSGAVRERIVVAGHKGWYFNSKVPRVAFEETSKGVVLTSIQTSVPEPTDPHRLTPEQKAVAVTFYFEDVVEIPFNLQVMQIGNPQNIPKGLGQAFMFAGTYCSEPVRRLQFGWPLFPSASNVQPPPPTQPPEPTGIPVKVYTPATDQVLERLPPATAQQCNPSAPPLVSGVGPADLPPAVEAKSVSIRFAQVSTVSLTLAVRGGCGHNFLFAGKVCVTGQCDPCRAVASCRFREWAEWGVCSTDCGGGQMNRTREIVRTPKGTHGSGDCEGALSWVRSCNTVSCDKDCTPRDCAWDDWLPWSSCDKCGGQKTRSRHIRSDPDCGGRACEAIDSEETAACPRTCHGQKTFCVWGGWSVYSECSAKCGCGRRSRVRNLVISNQPPADVSVTDLDERYAGFDDLQERVQRLQTRHVQGLVVAFVAGLMSLIVGFTACRAFSRARYARLSPGSDEEAVLAAPATE